MNLTRRLARVVAVAAVLLPGAAFAQEKTLLCAADKIVAAAGYQSCILWADALDAKKPDPAKHDELVAGCIAKATKAWARAERVYGADCPKTGDLPAIQSQMDQCAANTTGETVPPRFADNGDGTIADSLTLLTWEQKTGTPGDPPNPADPHDVNNTYSWSLGAPWDRDGTAYTEFLAALNTPPGLGGRTDWRLPTIAEMGGPANPLQGAIIDRYAPGCGRVPYPSCLPTPLLPSALGEYWSDTTYANDTQPWGAWYASFRFRTASHSNKGESRAVRAVAGGS
ncbi:MAG: DUF1566 domain-containing protein [Alphaproteobacteria bacterium]